MMKPRIREKVNAVENVTFPHWRRKIAWVKWDRAISSYGDGGLDIESLKVKNLALLVEAIRVGGLRECESRCRIGLDLQGRAIESFDNLKELIGNGSFSHDRVDKWEWKLDLNVVFFVRSFAWWIEDRWGVVCVIESMSGAATYTYFMCVVACVRLLGYVKR
uniref:RNA-directed DNA polymerase, eukaryota, reverse transcriptase zinc-binding domain protein n=1 Tax=Tanacetum cinerariifolium TaxID=118510 RepID=A0A6L2NK49_TANCI|nr:hypothetical protein [Tanacetum cinerariifolium]